MAEHTGIQWTNHTWNPHIGCHHLSTGCRSCYMFAEMRRYGKDPNVVTRTKTWGDPKRWQKKAAAVGVMELVFTCSWSDFFIEEADPWRDEAWALMKSTPNLIYQVLTKRIERVANHLPADWGDGYPNCWLGVSVENQKYADLRIPLLLEVPAQLRFLSCEPLLSAVDLSEWLFPYGRSCDAHVHDSLTDLPSDALGWVIGGGESNQGKGKGRPFDLAWARSLRDQCAAAGVPYHLKQIGSNPYETEPSAWPNGYPYGSGSVKLSGDGFGRYYVHGLKDSHGGDMAEWPADIRVREMPAIAPAPSDLLF